MALEETKTQSKSREKLVGDMQQKMNRSQGRILDLVESAIGNKERYNTVRPKILRETNDFMRALEKILNMNYRVEFEATNEDLIVVNKQS